MTGRPVDAVLFDLDGTLLDSESAIIASLLDALHDEGYERTAEDARVVFGLPLEEMLRRLADTTDPARVEALLAAYWRHSATRIPYPLLPGATALLDALAERRTPLGIVTNKVEASARSQMRMIEWERRFGAIVGLGTAPRPKPAADPALFALQILGVAPERAAFVGDTESDILCARAAGIPLIVVRTGTRTAAQLRSAGATHTVDTLDEVLPLLLGAEVRA